MPSDLAVEYYRQRAGAGLIVSEATSVAPMGVGYPATPGIWSDEQTEGWKKITDAVHGVCIDPYQLQQRLLRKAK